MFSNRSCIASALQSFRIEDRMLNYSTFVPRLYNWCLSLGFTPGKIMPSRAFCSDESQGYPIILVAKHFGAFPFNHGRVGGIVSVDRHGPHADHGKDLLLIQASHVGYDPESGKFGTYRRLHNENENYTCNCGKIGHLLEWYAAEYNYACENIRLLRHGGRPAIQIDNLLLSSTRKQGLFLILDNLVADADQGMPVPLAAHSTSYAYPASRALIARLGEAAWPQEGSVAIGKQLSADDFHFQREWRHVEPTLDHLDQLERNLLVPMPWILTSRHPLLTAACANTQAEFDRTYRSLILAPAMRGKNLLFLAGINIDISPNPDDTFPLTKFVPWAAFQQSADGSRTLLEQDEVMERLRAQPAENPMEIDLNHLVEVEMTKDREISVRL